MNPNVKQLMVAASPLLAFVLAAFGLSALLGLRGADAWLLRGGMIVLGGASSGLTWWTMRSMRRAGGEQPPAASSPERDIDAAFAAAQAQLASSRAAGKTTLSALPAVLVLGPGGSAKTTSVIRSGLDAELLAGGVMTGETVVPTSNVNVWYGREAIVVEAGGPLLAQAAAWSRVLHHVRPSRMAAMFGRNAQAPRAAVVCIGCDRLLEPGGAEATMSAARLIRERLGELSRTLGTRLPVFVLFTKMDRVPYFADWVRGFTKADADDVLGATLPADLSAAAGSYTDRETTRLNASFDQMVRSLGARRLDVLSREYVADHRAAAYEFPREFRKLAKPVIDFLVEIGRPSQLQVSPFLRGFYFTGVQAVLVSDAAPARVQAPASKSASATGRGIGATNVFEQPARPAEPLQPLALTPSVPGVRKVPRWVFLERLFPEVVLGDAPALEASRSGAGVDAMRRAGLASAAAVGLLMTLGLVVSFIGNLRLESRAVAEARAVAALPAAQLDLPSTEQLARLDSLRGRLLTLAGWDRDGAPLRLRFGLFSGASLIEPASRIWFDAFERVMFDETRRALEYGVRAFPDTARPGDDYGARYDLLKAYLVTSAHPDQSDPRFLTPVLMRHWLAGRELDADRTELVRRQFDHYGAALPLVRPFADSADTAAVGHARRYLLQSAGSEPIYRSMIADASSRHPSIQLQRVMASAAGVVANSYEVPGAFTREGWTAMQSALANIDRYYQVEPWVLGEAPNLPRDRDKLVADLRTRYEEQYVEQWRGFLAAGSVPRFADLREASRKLAETSGNRSPLLGMLAIAARHTAVDSSIAAAFQPVHLVTPPTLESSFLADANRPYVDALIALQSAVNQTAVSMPGQEDQAAGQATTAAASARVAARTLAQGFAPGADARVAASVLRLLEDPIARVEPLLRTVGTGELNVRGQRFCAVARPILSRLPFAQRGASAGVDDVTRFFRPGSGDLWRFHDDALSRVVERQGGRLVAKPSGTVSVAPAMVTFMDRALAFSDAFFRDGSSEMRLQFELMPLTTDATPLVAITLDGREVISGFNVVRQRMVWMARSGHEARLEATIGGTRTTLLSFDGPWAIFQLFHAAETFRADGDDYHVEWTFRGRGPQGENVTIAAKLGLGAAPVLRRDYFSGFNCTGEVVR